MSGVRRRNVAGIEALLGGAERLAQKCDVAALGFDQCLIGDHVHVGGDGIEQDALTGIAQSLPARQHLKFRNTDAVRGLEAVKQVLRDRDANGPWLQRRSLDGVIQKQIANRLQSGAEARDDLRTIAGQRLRHAFVGGALPGAAGIELRIGLIGFDQGFAQRLGPRLCSEPGRQRETDSDARHTEAPAYATKP